MSNNKMLIDATHPEETRVVVLHGGRVEEFDYESAARKLLRGNIYLAKITRVEPSLQAAFVEYGGNRHGFLAFNEIHPDYYQIPVADRQALLDEEAAAEAEEEAYVDAQAEARAQRGEEEPSDDAAEPPEELTPAAPEPTAHEGAGEGTERTASQPAMAAEAAPLDEILADPLSETFGGSESVRASSETEAGAVSADAAPVPETPAQEGGVQEVGNGGEPESVEQVGSEDALEELP
jgi:ribonuclease E